MPITATSRELRETDEHVRTIRVKDVWPVLWIRRPCSWYRSTALRPMCGWLSTGRTRSLRAWRALRARRRACSDLPSALPATRRSSRRSTRSTFWPGRHRSRGCSRHPITFKQVRCAMQQPVVCRHRRTAGLGQPCRRRPRRLAARDRRRSARRRCVWSACAGPVHVPLGRPNRLAKPGAWASQRAAVLAAEWLVRWLQSRVGQRGPQPTSEILTIRDTAI